MMRVWPMEKYVYDNISRKTFGNYVKKCRKAKKMTQQQLGEAVNLQTKSISYIERGVNYPSQENIFKIAKVLDMSLDEYVYGYKNNNQVISISEINDLINKFSGAKRNFLIVTMKNICDNLKDV